MSGAGTSTCDLDLDLENDASYTATLSLSDGFNYLEKGALGTWNPPYDITTMEISCNVSAGETAFLEWIEITNGLYGPQTSGSVATADHAGWAPARDQFGDDTWIADADGGFAFAFGGQATTIVRESAGGTLWIGSDVGGLATSSDGIAWTHANEGGAAFRDNDDLDITEIAFESSSIAYALTGRYQSSVQGKLFQGDLVDGAWAWTPLVGASEIAAVLRVDPCGDTDTQPALGGGELLIYDSGLDQLIAANHLAGSLGVSVYDLAGDTTCDLSGFGPGTTSGRQDAWAAKTPW